MATCCFCSLQDPHLLLGRWWTRPPHTHRHHYHPPHPPHPLLRPPWSPGPSQHPRSRRMRLISIWQSKTERSTGTKIHNCKKKTYCKHPNQIQMSDTWWLFSCHRCRHGALGKCVHCVPLEVREFIFVFLNLMGSDASTTTVRQVYCDFTYWKPAFFVSAFWRRLPESPRPTSEAHVIPRVPSQANRWSW